jgi:hypothetical protein
LSNTNHTKNQRKTTPNTTQTTQWPEEKGQKNKQRSAKHTYKTKDSVTRTPLKTGGELRYSGRVSSSCATSDTRHVNLVTNLVMNEERTGKCFRQVEHIRSHLWHRYSITVNQVVVKYNNNRYPILCSQRRYIV